MGVRLHRATIPGAPNRAIKGFIEVIDPESFLVDKENHLHAGEAHRAPAWAEGLFALVPRR